MSRKLFRLPMLFLLAYALLAFPPAQLAQQSPTSKSAGNSGALAGTRIFSTRCAACHGRDGRGAERGPNIATRPEIQHLSDKALLRIVQEGVPGTGMPSFGSRGASGIQAVVGHLRTLQGRGPAVELPGNPNRGKALFFGNPGCSQCHMTNGEGGFIGSDLSSYSTTQSVDEIRSAITDPNKNLDPRKRTVIVTTADGKTQTGIARNEDNFSLQLQTLDGTFHSFAKSDLQNIEHQPRSLMPADYGTKLSRQELDDLVSYLMNIGRTREKRKPQRDEN